MNEHPYMPLYFGDVLRKTLYWRGEERSLLILLMAAQWWNGPLPLDLSKLADAIQYNDATFRNLWDGRVHSLFIETPNGFIYPELEDHRRTVTRMSSARRAAGRASGKARRARSEPRESSTDADGVLEQKAIGLLEQRKEHDVQTKPRTNGGGFARTPIQSNPNQSKPDPEPPLSGSASVVGKSTSQPVLPLEPDVEPASAPSSADPPPAATASPGPTVAGKSPARRRRLPADYSTEPWRVWARENTPRVDFDAEVAMLRDHEFRDAHSDWDAVIRNWLRRAEKQPRAQGEGRLTRFEQHKRRLFGDA